MCNCLPDSFWTVPPEAKNMVKGKRKVWDGQRIASMLERRLMFLGT